VRAVINSSGSVLGRVSYDAYGTPTGTGVSSNTPFGFAGGYTDATGLVYLVDRYYDPQTGQFLSVDPLVDETGEPYGYAGGDPVDGTDPSGLAPCEGDEANCDGLGPGGGNLLDPADQYYNASNAADETEEETELEQEQQAIAEQAQAQAEQAIDAQGPTGTGQECLLSREGEGVNFTNAAEGELSIEAADGTEVTGFTSHGINRVIGDAAGRAGVTPQALLDALKNPTKIIEGVDDLGRPYKIYIGQDARVVINPETGNVVSVNPLSGAGANR
jgi:RHS repeat-associated protein